MNAIFEVLTASLMNTGPSGMLCHVHLQTVYQKVNYISADVALIP